MSKLFNEEWEVNVDYFLDKVNNGVVFDEEEHEHLIDMALEKNVLYTGRWNEQIEVIIKIDDKYYATEYGRGLTEMQENEYGGKVWEVEKKEVVITTHEWMKVK